MDRTKYLDPREVLKLQQVAMSERPIVWMVVDMALQSGLRVSEMAQVILEHFDFDRGTMQVNRSKRKEGKPRIESLHISDTLLAHVQTYCEYKIFLKGPLFFGQRGPMTHRGLQQIWDKVMLKAGLPKGLSIHCARHTYAVELMEVTNGNLRQVQKQLGHASPVTTANMYADVRPSVIKSSINQMYGVKS